ncbi:hypothetical protein FHR56_002426 [Xanthomonas sacchari]|uniref:hypothetical protein n=1 Tax=unclassified Xanthomonas TaxID=2643310 RepID=UPI00136EE5BA|nr:MULTISPECIES: hypothetical protein [unclassified Xanthomonas]MBB6367261.1 hypothetical protein [Xanthomonas sp. F10]
MDLEDKNKDGIDIVGTSSKLGKNKKKTRRSNKAKAEPVLNAPAVDNLLILCEEVTRATPEGARRFIEPAPGVLARAKSRQHNIIFGRRGSGKSSLLRKAVADLTVDRRPISFVDMETFKGHTYPDVLISVLIKSLQEFKSWLEVAATTPASKTSFWKRLFGVIPSRPAFNKAETQKIHAELSGVIKDLEDQLRLPETMQIKGRKALSSESDKRSELKSGISLSAVSLSGDASSSNKETEQDEVEATYTSHKIEYLHQNILRFQAFFRALANLSDGPAFLVLDDLYHIRRTDQAKVVDYFHRVGKGNDLWLKIGTIKHRSEWYQHSDPPIGMKLGDDAKEINLDVSLEKFETLKEFLKKVIGNLCVEAGLPSFRDLINPTAIDRLIIASGGVTRDFIGILSGSIAQARDRPASDHRGPKVGAEDVNLASGDYDTVKREEFKLDTAEDREALEQAFVRLVDFCTQKSKCNVFLLSQKLTGEDRDAIDQLIDLRLIHSVKSRVTLKRGASGEIFEAYMLDLSQYTAARKVHQFEMVELGNAGNDEAIRKDSLIYPPRRNFVVRAKSKAKMENKQHDLFDGRN